jgi:hypothetical protein
VCANMYDVKICVTLDENGVLDPVIHTRIRLGFVGSVLVYNRRRYALCNN